MGPRAHNLAGKVFGRLTATDKHEVRGRRRAYWLCACQCGGDKWVLADALKKGVTQSCGCLNDESRRRVKHGGASGGHSPEYRAWHHMKQRCLNEKNGRFNRYGARGIDIHPSWVDDFEAFLRDMGPRPKGTSIERIDNDKGYGPTNCKWATTAEQSRNHSRNRFVTFEGETMCVADWVNRTGVPHATLHYRLKNWPIERALTTPPRTAR